MLLISQKLTSPATAKSTNANLFPQTDSNPWVKLKICVFRNFLIFFEKQTFWLSGTFLEHSRTEQQFKISLKFFWIESRTDNGSILDKQKFSISNKDDATSLYEKITSIGKTMLIKNLNLIKFQKYC